MGKKKKYDEDNEGYEDDTPPRVSSVDVMLLSIKRLDHEPKDDDEKKSVYRDLSKLKMHRMTNTECAAKLGVSERTIYNYLKDPLYAETVSTIESEAKDGATLLVSDMAYKALDVLHEVMSDGEVSPFVRMEAAKYTLKMLGMEQEREPNKRANQDDVVGFLTKVKAQQTVIQVNVNNTPGQTVIESESSSYSHNMPTVEQVLPGGKFPGAVDPPLLKRLQGGGKARERQDVHQQAEETFEWEEEN